jgi:glycosyltransferase involved in cell wall biosynthesis
VTHFPLSCELAKNLSLEVVVPVYNEELTLATNINTLVGAMDNYLEGSWRVLIANNGSTDRTLAVAEELASHNPQQVGVLHLNEKGRGRALRAAWLASDAAIVAYTDVDLSTNLRHLPQLLQPLIDGQRHVATGNRLMRESAVERQIKREVVSRVYNALVKIAFPRRRVTDMQCGFKALTREAVHHLVPMVEDQTWFFDTELFIRAEQLGYEIHQIPVEWIEDLDSRVRIVRTALDNLKGLLRVRVTRPSLESQTTRSVDLIRG